MVCEQTGFAPGLSLDFEVEKPWAVNMSVAVFDFDCLARLNDELTVTGVDALLKRLAGDVRCIFEGAWYYRTGSDEFTVLSPDGEELFLKRVEQFKRHVAGLELGTKPAGWLTVSAGFALGGSEGTSTLERRWIASERLEFAKKFVSYENGMPQRNRLPFDLTSIAR